MKRNIVLTGMPGSGKSTVGRALAERLALQFLDLDTAIERRAGKPVAEIFTEGGEGAFRRLERDIVADLGDLHGTLVATGGWTFGDAASRATLAALGDVVCLDAPPEVLWMRLSSESESRPLQMGATDPVDRLGALLRARRPVYDALPWHVGTAGRTPDAVARTTESLLQSVRHLDASAVPVLTPGGGYAVLIGAGLLSASGAVLSALLPGVESAVIVSDGEVGPLYGSRASKSLEAAGLQTSRATMGVGEPAKTLETLSDLYNAFVLSGIDRHGLVVALGGGVVGDTVGFAAATYMRGIRTAQVPTSLLAMVDAAVGGKTAVNLAAGKNLVGAFHHPVLVISDPEVLATLREEDLRRGLAEVVKAAMIGDAGLFELLESGAPDVQDPTAWAHLIGRAVAVKAAIVSRDPHEAGERAVLNLGHTFAHGLERASGYRVAHGDAVAVGLVAACHLAARLGLAEPDLQPRVERTVTRLGLPASWPGIASADVASAMAIDKKRQAGRMRFVLPRAIGDVALVDDVPMRDAIAVLDRICGGEPVDAPATRS